MAYQIRYGAKLPQEQAAQKPMLQWLGLGLLALTLGFSLLWPQTAQTARQLLCPWAHPETEAAFQAMLDQIGQGQAVGEAVLVFCREVLSHAGIPV